MSGHSKWHNIKRKKEVSDKKKATLFTRLAQEIKSAAEKGTDPDANAGLRDAIARAKKAGLPQANIDRLLSGKDAPQQQTMYEAFGPNGMGLLIIAHTDNPNRTVAEVRTILKNNGGSLGAPNSVKWKFQLDPSSNSYLPSYTQPIEGEAKQQLDTLLERLATHPDIDKIFTDAA